MPANPKQSVVILDEADEITLADLTRACRVHAEWVMELVEEGVIEPRGKRAARNGALRRRPSCACRRRSRLHSDLGINLPGVALALQLLDRIDALEARMRAARRAPRRGRRRLTDCGIELASFAIRCPMKPPNPSCR